MADLIVTFARIATDEIGLAVPLEVGKNVRTEAVEITAASAQTGYSAQAGESVVDIYAGADCWIEIGADPTAEAIASSTAGNGTGTSRKLLSGDVKQFTVAEGDKVAVIEA